MLQRIQNDKQLLNKEKTLLVIENKTKPTCHRKQDNFNVRLLHVSAMGLFAFTQCEREKIKKINTNNKCYVFFNLIF